MRVAAWLVPIVVAASLLMLWQTGAPESRGALGQTRSDDVLQLDFVMPSYAGPGTATCSPPNADNGKYVKTGFKMSNVFSYKLKTASFPSYLSSTDIQAAVNAAFSAWDASTAKALFSNGGTTTAKLASKDGVNAVGFGSVSGGALATAYTWYNSKTKTLVEFDIVLSNAYTWATNNSATGVCGGAANAYDVRAIVTHEVGHPVGLADLTAAADNAQTMYGYAALGELTKRDLANGDKAGLSSLYGP